VKEPTTTTVNDTEQEVVDDPPERVQLPMLPPGDEVKRTVPVGWVGLPDKSVTLAVHVRLRATLWQLTVV
jgi:hypothetical protein